MSSLVSSPNRVESPFIIVTIGDYTFGKCFKKEQSSKLSTIYNVTYPNFLQRLSVVKVNGAVNKYNLTMDFAVTERDDPNMLEKVFGSVSKTREISLTYGDWEIPTYMYKEESALITNVTSTVDMSRSVISYTLSCTSAAFSLNAGTFHFPARNAKGSDVLKELLQNSAYGLTNIFYGMKNMSIVRAKNLIASTDRQVSLKAKNCSVFEYIGYVVSCMCNVKDKPSSVVKNASYYWAVFDDVSNEFGGPYFKVCELDKTTAGSDSYNTYELDIGYPNGNYVTNFSLKTDNSWAILYDYSSKINQPQYVYRIDDEGKLSSEYSPAVTTSPKYSNTTELDRSWWTQMTQYPCSASVTIKGLLRPAMLMSYIRIKTYFFGKLHISSGLYIITKQEDTLDSSGYRTTLSLTRVGGDNSL